MAITVKKYLDEGASLTRGYGDRRRTQQIVPCYVAGLTDNSGAADAAVGAAKTAVGASITDDSVTIPLADATVQVLGPAIDGTLSALVYLKYGFTDSDPTLYDTFEFVKEEAFTERSSVTWRIFDHTAGTSSAATLDTDFTLASDESLYSVTTKAPIRQILAPFVTTTNALDTVEALDGHYNSDAVTIDGKDRAANTLKFQGVRQEAVDKRGGKVYRGFYVLDYFSLGYGTDQLTFRSVDDGSGNVVISYRIISGSPSPTATFADAFPTSQGTGPDAAV